MSKARELPGVGKCPAPGQCKICECPTPGTDKASKCPAVARGGGGWVQVELTDALRIKKSFCVLLDNSLPESKRRIKELSNLKATGKKIRQRFAWSEYLL